MLDSPNQKQQTSAPGLVDNRTSPPGVVKKTIQSWLIIGVIVLMMLVMWLSGGSKGKNMSPQGAALPEPKPAAMNATSDDIARHLAEIQRQQQQSLSETPGNAETVPSRSDASQAGSYDLPTGPSTAPAPTPDPVAEDLKKRIYTSLYSSNVALSYRKQESHPTSATEPPNAQELAAIPGFPFAPAFSPFVGIASPTTPQASLTEQALPKPTPKSIPVNPNQATGKDYTVFEGTLLETVLINRLDGDFSGPVATMVTTDVFSHDRQHLLIPAGSKLLGETKRVDAFGQRRLAVFFHRLIMPDGYSLDLDRFQGLNQVGETGLKDKVNNHYWQIFGASIAVGAIGGLAQLGTNGGTIAVQPSAADEYRQGVTASLSQSSLHILDRFLNVLPTITIREGQRVKVYITQDFLVPDYSQHTMPANL